MKNSIVVILLFTLSFVQAQNFRGLDKSPMDKATFPASHRISDKIVSITYSRPQLKGRAFEDIVPFGKIWRTGANEATELRIFKPIEIGGVEIPEGTYAIFTIFESEKMTFVVNKAKNLWGAYAYSKEKDLLRFEVLTTAVEDNLEAFSMVFSGGDALKLHLGWEYTRAAVPFKVL
tara:strand:- start:453 stop:980 length:528 start_codon:yes stop_codon:yes gene_type:complete